MSPPWLWIPAVCLALLFAAFWWMARSRRANNGTVRQAPAAEAASANGAATAPAAPAIPAAAPPVAREATAASPLLLVIALALDDADAARSGALDPSDTQLLMGASQELARIGTESRYTPRRPSLLPQLLEAVNDEDASLRALSRIISQDPALTGDLLRTSNRALYRVSGSPVESIERACAMLGTQGLRTLIAASLVKPLAGEQSGAASGRFGELTWEHSICSASAAEAWAARAQDCDPFTAHLLGLMHGLGDVAVYRVVRDVIGQQKAAHSSALIAHALATQGAVTARRIASSWGLSDRTQEALEAQSAAAPSFEVTPLALALRFGRLAGALVLLCRHQKMTQAQASQALDSADFKGPQVERIWDRLVRAYVNP
jgi:HD-like signal output (HDOD) protein